MKSNEEKIKVGDSVFFVNAISTGFSGKYYSVHPAVARNVDLIDGKLYYHALKLDQYGRTYYAYDHFCFHRKENAIEKAKEMMQNELQKLYTQRKRLSEREQTEEIHMRKVETQIVINLIQSKIDQL